VTTTSRAREAALPFWLRWPPTSGSELAVKPSVGTDSRPLADRVVTAAAHAVSTLGWVPGATQSPPETNGFAAPSRPNSCPKRRIVGELRPCQLGAPLDVRRPGRRAWPPACRLTTTSSSGCSRRRTSPSTMNSDATSRSRLTSKACWADSSPLTGRVLMTYRSRCRALTLFNGQTARGSPTT
jgi:hypothetical protein